MLEDGSMDIAVGDEVPAQTPVKWSAVSPPQTPARHLLVCSNESFTFISAQAARPGEAKRQPPGFLPRAPQRPDQICHRLLVWEIHLIICLVQSFPPPPLLQLLWLDFSSPFPFAIFFSFQTSLPVDGSLHSVLQISLA